MGERRCQRGVPGGQLPVASDRREKGLGWRARTPAVPGLGIWELGTPRHTSCRSVRRGGPSTKNRMFQFVQFALKELNGMGKSGKPGYARAMGLLGDDGGRDGIHESTDPRRPTASGAWIRGFVDAIPVSPQRVNVTGWRMPMRRPLAGSNSRMRPSKLPVKRRFPSGLKARLNTAPSWPPSVAVRLPSAGL